jgi:hypothetical protein
MKRLWMLLVGLMCLTACGCEALTQAEDYRDAAAVDLAAATMTSSPAPSPPVPEKCPRCGGTGWIEHGDGHRTPCPDCQGQAGDAYGGPLDTLHDAKELIRKGNELADRSKAIFDQAELDGKITVDVRLPKPAPTQARSGSCPGGICPLVPPLPVDAPPEVAAPAATQGCSGGVCRPGLFGRRRR